MGSHFCHWAKSLWPPMVCLRRMFFFLVRPSGERLLWVPTPNMSSTDVRRRNLRRSVIFRRHAGSVLSDSLREEEEVLRLAGEAPRGPGVQVLLPRPPSTEDSLSVLRRAFADFFLERVSHSMSLWEGRGRGDSGMSGWPISTVCPDRKSVV